MANVKIILDHDETQADVEDQLFKALNLHRSGEVHDEEAFEDPAMQDVLHRMQKIHKDIFADMMNEIQMELEKEYVK